MVPGNFPLQTNICCKAKPILTRPALPTANQPGSKIIKDEPSLTFIHVLACLLFPAKLALAANSISSEAHVCTLSFGFVEETCFDECKGQTITTKMTFTLRV